MEYRRLGRSGAVVSEIALGSWLTAGGQYDEANTIRIHHRARELGINFFDTADVYNRGEAERIVGKAVREMNRDEIVVATKCRGKMGDGPNMVGLSKKHIIQACDASLKRLGLDYIDLYQFHHQDRDVPIDESVSAIGHLLRAGKILYWGLSNHDAKTTADMVATARELGVEPPVTQQPKYNMFRRDVETDGVMETCYRNSLGLIVYSPLEQGLLSGKYTSRDKIPEGSRLAVRNSSVADQLLTDYNLTAVRELKAIAEKRGWSLVQLALAWILRRTEVTAAIVGATRVEHIESNAAASGLKIDDAEEEINRILDTRWATIKINDYKRVLESS